MLANWYLLDINYSVLMLADAISGSFEVLCLHQSSGGSDQKGSAASGAGGMPTC